MSSAIPKRLEAAPTICPDLIGSSALVPSGSTGERVPDQNRIVPLGRGAYERDRAADHFLDPADIFDRSGRQIGPAPRPARRSGPALDFFIDRFDAQLVRGVRRQIVELLAADRVAG